MCMLRCWLMWCESPWFRCLQSSRLSGAGCQWEVEIVAALTLDASRWWWRSQPLAASATEQQHCWHCKLRTIKNMRSFPFHITSPCISDFYSVFWHFVCWKIGFETNCDRTGCHNYPIMATNSAAMADKPACSGHALWLRKAGREVSWPYGWKRCMQSAELERLEVVQQFEVFRSFSWTAECWVSVESYVQVPGVKEMIGCLLATWSITLAHPRPFCLSKLLSLKGIRRLASGREWTWMK